MLKAIRRDAFVGGILKFIMWLFFLVIMPYLTWLYLQPYIEDVLRTYNGVKDTTNSIRTTSSADFSAIQDFFKQFSDKK